MAGLFGLIAFGAFGIVAAIAEGESQPKTNRLTQKSRSTRGRK